MAQEYRAKDAPQPPREEPTTRGPHKYRRFFHGAPVTAPGGAVPFQVPEEFADDLGRHLERNAFWRREELIDMAGPDGLLDVTTLPAPTVRQDPPESGPDSWLNPGPWVPVSTPLPDRAVRRRADEIDLDDLTDEQAEAIRVENEAIQAALARRERWRARLAEADERVAQPAETDEEADPGDDA